MNIVELRAYPVCSRTHTERLQVCEAFQVLSDPAKRKVCLACARHLCYHC
jgi:hypothetical protein